MLRHVLQLMTGTGIATLIPILATPILTRIYTPEEFGVGEIYLISTILLAMVVTLRLDAALIIPKDANEARKILNSVFTNSLFVSGAVLIGAGGGILTGILEEVFILLPLSVLLVGLFETCICFNIRNQQFKQIGLYKSLYLFSIVLFKIILGSLGYSYIGIIVGTVIGQFIGFVAVFFFNSQNADFSFQFHLENWKEVVFDKYSDFPKHNLPQTFFNNAREYLLSFIIVSLYTNTVLGLYALTLKMVKSPLYVLGHSFSDVAFQRFSRLEDRKDYKDFISFNLKTFLGLAPIYFVFFYFLSDMVASIFGNGWQMAGDYALIMSPWFYFAIVSITLEKLGMVLRKQKEIFRLNMLFDSIAILSFFMASYLGKDFVTSLIIVSFFGSVARVAMIVYVCVLLRENFRTRFPL